MVLAQVHNCVSDFAHLRIIGAGIALELRTECCVSIYHFYIYWMSDQQLFKMSFSSFVRGNALRQGSSWRGSRGLVIFLLVALCVCAISTWLYVTSLDSDVTETLARHGELVSPKPRVYTVQCSEDYENYKRYPGKALLQSGSV